MENEFEYFKNENIDEYRYRIKMKKELLKRSTIEHIMRIKKSPVYNNENEVRPFISFAKKFNRMERALTLLHNCHVVRINSDYPSDTKKLVNAVKRIFEETNLVYSCAVLEAITEYLSSRKEYSLTEEEKKKVKEISEDEKEKQEKDEEEDDEEKDPWGENENKKRKESIK